MRVDTRLSIVEITCRCTPTPACLHDRHKATLLTEDGRRQLKPIHSLTQKSAGASVPSAKRPVLMQISRLLIRPVLVICGTNIYLPVRCSKSHWCHTEILQELKKDEHKNI